MEEPKKEASLKQRSWEDARQLWKAFMGLVDLAKDDGTVERMARAYKLSIEQARGELVKAFRG